EIVKELPCDPGCHGVNFGAKKGGGYYAYVSSTFSNEAIVVDGDPNNDGDPKDAQIAGKFSLVASHDTMTDDKVTELGGTGGQGVLAIPNVYDGWVQNLPSHWKGLLTDSQQNPLGAPL
ncbi:MAG TPA: copper oxidase, partial [Nitrososphaeraceae archaeon]|nr:copper oxidase [Nitrososphaeraceae archaeon]